VLSAEFVRTGNVFVCKEQENCDSYAENIKCLFMKANCLGSQTSGICASLLVPSSSGRSAHRLRDAEDEGTTMTPK